MPVVSPINSNWQEIETFLNERFSGHTEKKQKQTQLLHRVSEGTFFGAVKVDIKPPPHLKEKLSEMTPVFKDLKIRRSDVGEHMQSFAEEHDIVSTPRRALNGSYQGEKNLLGTPLLKFYLRLAITHVHQAFQWLSYP